MLVPRSTNREGCRSPADVETREEQLAAAEARLLQARPSWRTPDRSSTPTRRQSLQKLTAERHELITECRRAKSEEQTERQSLSAQFDELDRRNAELKLLRSEVLDLQRETLEMRAALEALWGQRRPTLSQPIFCIRFDPSAKLAEEFRSQAAIFLLASSSQLMPLEKCQAAACAAR